MVEAGQAAKEEFGNTFQGSSHVFRKANASIGLVLADQEIKGKMVSCYQFLNTERINKENVGLAAQQGE